jgi:hypothetical protein
MEAYTTMINVDYEAALKLASSISLLVDGEDGPKFLEESSAMIEAGDLPALVAKILAQEKAIFDSEMDADTEAIFQGLALFLFKEDEKVHEVVKSVTTCLTSTTDVKPKLRLKILVSLFNLLVFPAAKYAVLTSVFSYANATGQSGQVSHFHPRVDGWTTAWSLSAGDKRALFLLMATTLEADAKLSDSLQFLVKYLDTYAGETLPTDVQQTATTAVVNAIKAPVGAFKYRAVLQESLAAQKLGNADLTDLMALLTVLCEGTLAEYQNLANSKGSVMQANGIDQDVVLSNMRLLSLCGMCAEVRSVSYADIASELGVPVDEAEMWVVMAIGEELIVATMDQAQECVTVTRATARRFGKQQWVALNNKLKTWHGNMTSILANM